MQMNILCYMCRSYRYTWYHGIQYIYIYYIIYIIHIWIYRRTYFLKRQFQASKFEGFEDDLHLSSSFQAGEPSIGNHSAVYTVPLNTPTWVFFSASFGASLTWHGQVSGSSSESSDRAVGTLGQGGRDRMGHESPCSMPAWVDTTFAVSKIFDFSILGWWFQVSCLEMDWKHPKPTQSVGPMSGSSFSLSWKKSSATSQVVESGNFLHISSQFSLSFGRFQRFRVGVFNFSPSF